MTAISRLSPSRLRWTTCLMLAFAVLSAAPGSAVPIQQVDETLIIDLSDQMQLPPPVPEREFGHSRPPSPPLTDVRTAPAPTPRAEVRPAPGAGPLRISPCFTREEYNRAGLGTGCSCTCDEYARLASKAPAEQRRCSVACGVAYYRCWAPPPTDAEIAAKVRDIGPAGPVMLAQPDGRSFIVSGMMMERAMAWEEAQRCRVD